MDKKISSSGGSSFLTFSRYSNYESVLATSTRKSEPLPITDEPAFEAGQTKLEILIITAHQMWAQALTQSFTNSAYQNSISVFLTNETDIEAAIKQIYTISYDVIIISAASLTANDISWARALRQAGSNVPILFVANQFILPSLDDLIKSSIQGIVSSFQSLPELHQALQAVAAQQRNVLKQQYLRAARYSVYQQPGDYLTEAEKNILELIAADLTDQEIADRMGLNVRTVNNKLRLIYAKLGVKSRAGAVASAFTSGSLNLQNVIATKLALSDYEEQFSEAGK